MDMLQPVFPTESGERTQDNHSQPSSAKNHGELCLCAQCLNRMATAERAGKTAETTINGVVIAVGSLDAWSARTVRAVILAGSVISCYFSIIRTLESNHSGMPTLIYLPI